MSALELSGEVNDQPDIRNESKRAGSIKSNRASKNKEYCGLTIVLKSLSLQWMRYTDQERSETLPQGRNEEDNNGHTGTIRKCVF